MSEAGVHGLTAGYAVDALDREEAEAAERHLAECEDCRRDLSDFRETAVRLAGAETRVVRPEVWEAIRGAASRTRQLPPLTGEAGGTEEVGGTGARVVRLRSRTRWLPWALAAACALVAVVLAGTLVSMGQRMEADARHTARLEALLAAPDTNMLEAPLGDARATVFASYEMDAAVLVVEGLPSAPPGMAYQMWWADDGGVRPAGTLDPSTDGRHSGMADDMGRPDELRVSLESKEGDPDPGGEAMAIDM